MNKKISTINLKMQDFKDHFKNNKALNDHFESLEYILEEVKN